MGRLRSKVSCHRRRIVEERCELKLHSMSGNPQPTTKMAAGSSATMRATSLSAARRRPEVRSLRAARSRRPPPLPSSWRQPEAAAANGAGRLRVRLSAGTAWRRSASQLASASRLLDASHSATRQKGTAMRRGRARPPCARCAGSAASRACVWVLSDHAVCAHAMRRAHVCERVHWRKCRASMRSNEFFRNRCETARAQHCKHHHERAQKSHYDADFTADRSAH